MLCSLLQRANTNFYHLSAADLGYICANQVLLSNKSHYHRSVKEEFFYKVEQYIITNYDKIIFSKDRRCVQNLMMGLVASKKGSIEAFQKLENIMINMLKQDIQDNQSLNKQEVMSTVHSLTMRKVQNKELW